MASATKCIRQRSRRTPKGSAVEPNNPRDRRQLNQKTLESKNKIRLSIMTATHPHTTKDHACSYNECITKASHSRGFGVVADP